MTTRVVFVIFLGLVGLGSAHAQSPTPRRPTGASRACPSGGKVIADVDLAAIPITFDELVEVADLIVRGTITKVFPSYHPDPNNTVSIETDSDVSIAETFRGLPGATHVALAQLGGKTKVCEEIVPNDPLVEVGDTYILFLTKDKRPSPNPSGLERYSPFGMWHGKAKIVNNKVQFLPEASVGLHKHDDEDVADFSLSIQQISSKLQPTGEHYR